MLRKLIFIKLNIFTNLLILLSTSILLVACNGNLEQENKALLIENEYLKLGGCGKQPPNRNIQGVSGVTQIRLARHLIPFFIKK